MTNPRFTPYAFDSERHPTVTCTWCRKSIVTATRKVRDRALTSQVPFHHNAKLADGTWEVCDRPRDASELDPDCILPNLS